MPADPPSTGRGEARHCWVCGIEPHAVLNVMRSGQVDPVQVIVHWPPAGDHHHHETPPSDAALLQQGADRADEALRYWLNGSPGPG